jgi:4-amino-4-deoxy-L-arabinose transferase-like glycosyltransferase
VQVERPQQLLEKPGAGAPAGTVPAVGGARTGLPWIRRLHLGTAALALAIVAVAAVLRLWMIEADAQNPFYDAAVRSMGLSWHNFFFGALDPDGSLAIDKPPVDLWLQVASTKLLGFDRAALALPEALGGTAAVALLYAAVKCACGRLAGALAALALAVLPIAVLTSRSDTMDSLMSALLIAALWSAIVATRRRQARYVLASAALVGLAFNVKLAQALIPLPALALLWWAGARPGRRLAVGAGALAALVMVAMAWASVASLTPREERPMPMGSRGTGSILRSMFVFNGIERITGSSQGLAPVGFKSAPGPARLVSSAPPGYATLIGLELVGALVLAGAAAAAAATRRQQGKADPLAAATADSPAGRTADYSEAEAADHCEAGTVDPSTRLLAGALLLWLATGWVLFSFMKRLEPRYLEALAPAVAASIGVACAYLWRGLSGLSGLGGTRLGARGQVRLGGAGEAHPYTRDQTSPASRRVAWLAAGALALNAAFALSALGTGNRGAIVCAAASATVVLALCTGPLRRRLVVGRWRSAALALAAVALLAAPADASIHLAEQHASDANPGGSGNQYSAYLRAHQGKAHYEVAATNPLAVVGLIVQDARPVLILRSVDGVLVSVNRLRQLVHEGAVRFAIIAHPCTGGRHCTPTTAWSVRHATLVRPGLYRYRYR